MLPSHLLYNYTTRRSTLFKGCLDVKVDKHRDALLQVEAVVSSQNTRALRRLFDNISCHVRSLTSLGVESKSYGNLLCSVLLNKIPAELQLIVSRKVSESDLNLDLVINAIKEEITARERVGTGQSYPQERTQDSTHCDRFSLGKYIKCTNTLLLLQPAPFPGRLRYCHAS